MKRRKFITLLGSAAAWPFVARAQQGAMPVIGFLSGQASGGFEDRLAKFRLGLKESGYVEGQNITIEYRWANDQLERLPALAADLVHRQVAVIVAAGDNQPALVSKAATSTIPIVFANGGDAVKNGLVASLNRPGGNVTGVTFLTLPLASKRLDLLRALLPQATIVVFLNDPPNPGAEDYTSDILAAARTLARQVIVLDVDSAYRRSPEQLFRRRHVS
jgi:putative ABC transport system substrate-binding protein